MITDCPRHEIKLETFEVDCYVCEGKGMVDNKNSTVWIDCDHCGGTGEIITELCEKCNEEIL